MSTTLEARTFWMKGWWAMLECHSNLTYQPLSGKTFWSRPSQFAFNRADMSSFCGLLTSLTHLLLLKKPATLVAKRRLCSFFPFIYLIFYLYIYIYTVMSRSKRESSHNKDSDRGNLRYHLINHFVWVE